MDNKTEKSKYKLSVSNENKYLVSTLLIEFCMDELIKYREVLIDNTINTNTKQALPSIMNQYVKTAENLSNMIDNMTDNK